MRHTTTSFLRGAITWTLVPIRLVALILRTIAWIIDPQGGAPWNWGPIPRARRQRKN
jgi:hypothetical protein